MTFQVVKTYGPENGWSATFRQWRAKSHCRFIHGYALGVRVGFSCPDDERDENGWVFDFGGLKPFKAYLAETFDHKMLVARDDPALSLFRDMAKDHSGKKQLIQLLEVDRVGVESFAEMIHNKLYDMIQYYNNESGRKVRIDFVEVFEHHGNSATYYPG